MEKNCVLCLKDYISDDWIIVNRSFKHRYFEAGELFNLDAGKIYDNDNNWVCDLYSDEGIEHFVFIGDDMGHFIVGDEVKRYATEHIYDFQQIGLNKIHEDIVEMLLDYSIDEDRYRTMSEDSLIEGMESVVKLLKSEDFTPCMDKKDLLLDSLWCAMVLLDREVRED